MVTADPVAFGNIPAAVPHCSYFEAGVCRSCTFIETPIDAQLAAKDRECRVLLPGIPESAWLPPVFGGVAGFRNRAKLAVGGTAGKVTLGILDRAGTGVDLTDCLIHEPAIHAVIPTLARLLNEFGLPPYSVSKRRGELKYVHVTASPDGELMVRFVVRSEDAMHVLRKRLPEIREAIPQATVITVNILPEHRAVLEGEDERPLHGSSLAMRMGGAGREVTLHLRPQSFFQTNTRVAFALYDQARQWVDRVAPRSLLDLYCGVGGFALIAAQGSGRPDASGRNDTPVKNHTSGSTGGSDRHVLGVELSEQAVLSARRSAEEAGIEATFIAADASEFALRSAPHEQPEMLIVNPPRRGVGAELAGWIESSSIHHVIYSSCNPVSLAKDLALMPSLRVESARLFDMFPHTGHLEVAVLLERQ